MPSKLGETLSFYMYESADGRNFGSYCKLLRFKAKATLCSYDGDYVYLLESRMGGGAVTICGMY